MVEPPCWIPRRFRTSARAIPGGLSGGTQRGRWKKARSLVSGGRRRDQRRRAQVGRRGAVLGQVRDEERGRLLHAGAAGQGERRGERDRQAGRDRAQGQRRAIPRQDTRARSIAERRTRPVHLAKPIFFRTRSVSAA